MTSKRDLVLFCYDGSDDAKRAIEVTAALLAARDAVVVDVGPVLTGAESFAAVTESIAVSALQRLNTAGAQERADDGAAYAQRFGFEAEARAVLGDPVWEGVLDIADEVGASLIVVGSRALDGPQRLFEHSVSRGLAEHARRPLLIVPPPA